MGSKHNLDSLNSTLQGKDHLGDTVFWTVSQATVSEVDLYNQFVANGVSDVFFPEKPSRKALFTRAIGEAQTKYKSIANPEQKYLLRRVGTTESEVVYAVVAEDKVASLLQSVASETLEYSTLDTIVFNRDTEEVFCDNDHPLTELVKKIYDSEAGIFRNHDILGMLSAAMKKMDAVCLRDRGGVYYVPAIHAEKIRGIKKVVDMLGGSYVSLLTLYSTPETTGGLARSASISLQKELNDLKSELKEFSAHTRQSTVERRIEQFRDLKSRVEYYGEILDIAKDGLLSGISESETALQNMIL